MEVPTDSAERQTAACCADDPIIARHFDGRIAELIDEFKGELPPMVDVSEMLLGLLGDVADAHPTLLELGSGSAALTVELLRRGASTAEAVDLSPQMVSAARRRADEAGVGDRVSFHVGDGAAVDVAAHDWVVLDRVMCCYPDVAGLLANATRAATRRVAYSVPTSRGWRGLLNKIGWGFDNVPSMVRRDACRTFVHDIGRIDAALAGAGFARTRDAHLALWYAAVWDRLSP